jgi:hypothetical protein
MARGDLVGHRFPGASVSLPTHVAWLWADCVGGDPRASLAHPSAAYLLGLRGTGLGVDELLELFGSGPEAGPLLGGCGFSFHRPLLAARSYRGEGEVVAVESKRGRRAGAFDLVTFEVALHDRDEASIDCSYTWVIPRGRA